MMKTCRHIRPAKSFLCKECNKTLCRNCVHEELSVKQCMSCGQSFSKDDLNTTNCNVCKRCPLCNEVFRQPDGEEGKPARLRTRCYRCKAKFGGHLMSETMYNNILKVQDLVSHYRSYEFRGAGDNNGLLYWSGPLPSGLDISKAHDVTELDNCVEYLCSSSREFSIEDATPLKIRLQVPCMQYPWACQMIPVPLRLKPKYNYYCKRCDSMVLTNGP